MSQLSIKNLRKQARRSQKEVAELCDVSLTTYRKWESDPADMPHGLYLQLLDFLERAVQIRKETTMGIDMGKVKVVYTSIEESEREAKEHPYTVPIPEGLTEEFVPSKPVTDEQMMDWAANHIEPYPGYAEEEGAWERAWQEVEIAQLKADGEPVLEMDPVHVDPEFDPATGDPVVYDEPQIVQDPSSGKAELYLNESDLSNDELNDDPSKYSD